MSGRAGEKHVWTWPIAGYLFLGGLGAGMTLVAAVADLVFGLGSVMAASVAGSLVALGLGSFLLVFELGRPLAFWRVFSAQKAVLTFGAWMVSVLIVVDALYFSFLSGWFPWSGASGAQGAVAVIGSLLGCGVLVYTGVELASMRARVFWNTPALPVLFVFSGLLTGAGGDFLLVLVWTGSGIGTTGWAALGGLALAMMLFAAVTLFTVLLYVLMMLTSAGTEANTVARRWLVGRYALYFWVGVIGVGLLVPLVLLGVGISAQQASGGVLPMAVASALVMVQGVFLRFLVVYSDDRKMLAGELRRRERRPSGTELFLRAHKG
ncbi:MAG: polysulfide reductase NrfD [Coriobacteriales bacterium]|jgi:formate-dependent nitrite reductase membrane component NrfD|nr:polysulfide reductase NrfD [Coriobacteriales bacterium]